MKKSVFQNTCFILIAVLHFNFCDAQNLPVGKAVKTIDQHVDSVIPEERNCNGITRSTFLQRER